MKCVFLAPRKVRQELALSTGVLLLACGLGAGASLVPSDAGYAGVGPDFLPWLVAVALFVCSGLLFWEAASGGFRNVENNNENGAVAPCWSGFVWMSAGLLVNAALITTLGFIVSCAVCFVLAARGGRLAQGQAVGDFKVWAQDTVVGLVISAPVYWMFTKLLAISLPGLTHTGWL